MYIASNTASSNAQNYLRMNNNDLQTRMERLSSGSRINSAADDAAGLAISEKMTSQIRGMDTASRNAQDGVSLIQTSESAMGSISDILQRMRELSVQADNDTYSASDKTSIQSEITEMISEIDHIAARTTFNGRSLLNAAGTLNLHISDQFDDTLTIDTFDVTATTGLTLNAIDVTTDAQTAISDIDSALDLVSSYRADLGSKQNRLDFITNNLQTNKLNTESARSRISDADMAAESSAMTKARILSSSSMTMLQQANAQPQSVLQLLQG